MISHPSSRSLYPPHPRQRANPDSNSPVPHRPSPPSHRPHLDRTSPVSRWSTRGAPYCHPARLRGSNLVSPARQPQHPPAHPRRPRDSPHVGPPCKWPQKPGPPAPARQTPVPLPRTTPHIPITTRLSTDTQQYPSQPTPPSKDSQHPNQPKATRHPPTGEKSRLKFS